MKLSPRSVPGWVRLGLALAVLAVGLASVAGHATTGGDFRLSLWYPGQALLYGHDPYDVASFQRLYGVHQVEVFSPGWFPPYGPVHLWWCVLLAWLPVRVASALWFAADVVGLGVIAAVAVRKLDRRLGLAAVAFVAGILLLSRPGRSTVDAGQVTVLYVLLSYAAWHWARERPWLAAIALGLALGKPPFGLPLLGLLAIMGVWRVVVRAVAVFVALSLPVVGWLAANAGGLGRLWHAVVHDVSYSERNPLDAPGSRARIDALSLLARTLHLKVGGGSEVVAFVVLVGLGGLVAASAMRRSGWPMAPAVIMVLALCSLLGVAHEDYDLLLLAWPFAALWHGRLTTAAWCAPALLVSLIPAADTLKVLDLGNNTADVSTLTTVCLLLALGAVVVDLGRRRDVVPRHEQARPAPNGAGSDGRSSS